MSTAEEYLKERRGKWESWLRNRLTQHASTAFNTVEDIHKDALEAVRLARKEEQDKYDLLHNMFPDKDTTEFESDGVKFFPQSRFNQEHVRVREETTSIFIERVRAWGSQKKSGKMPIHTITDEGLKIIAKQIKEEYK